MFFLKAFVEMDTVSLIQILKTPGLVYGRKKNKKLVSGGAFQRFMCLFLLLTVTSLISGSGIAKYIWRFV